MVEALQGSSSGDTVWELRAAEAEKRVLVMEGELAEAKGLAVDAEVLDASASSANSCAQV